MRILLKTSNAGLIPFGMCRDERNVWQVDARDFGRNCTGPRIGDVRVPRVVRVSHPIGGSGWHFV